MEDFKNIKFEHINGDFEIISISEVNGLIKNPFDKIGVATNTYNKHFNNEESEYYHMTVDEIIDKWEKKGAISCQYGALLDDYIGFTLNEELDDREMFELDHDRDSDERLNGLLKSFDDFIEDYLKNHPELVFVNREKYVYHRLPSGKYVRGRFDALFYNTENKHYVIIDWKSSNEIPHQVNKWTKFCLGPAKTLYDMDWYTYTNQVYFYKTALENDGYLPEGTIVDCYIVQLPGHLCENNKYYMIHEPAYKYDKEFEDNIFEFAHKKKMLMEKKNGK